MSILINKELDNLVEMLNSENKEDVLLGITILTKYKTNISNINIFCNKLIKWRIGSMKIDYHPSKYDFKRLDIKDERLDLYISYNDDTNEVINIESAYQIRQKYFKQILNKNE